MKEQNIWVKKVEHGTIDPDEVALGRDKTNLERDGHKREGQETGDATGASSSIDFDHRSTLEAILGRFDSLDTRFESITTKLDSMEHKQNEIIAQVQQLQAFHHQPFTTHPPSSPHT